MLPSQTQVSGSGRSNMYRRRRNSRKPILIGLGVVVGLAVVLWLFTRGGGTPAVSADIAAGQPVLGPQTAAASPVTTSSPRTPAPAPAVAAREEPPPPVVELRQGRPEAASRTETTRVPSPSTHTEATGTPKPAATTPASPTTTASPGAVAPGPQTPAPPTGVQQPGATRPAVSGPSASGPLASAQQAQAGGDLIAARALYSRALADSRNESERASIRAELTRINDDLVFSRRIVAGDPYAYSYTIRTGDTLAGISQREGLAPDWRLIQRINGISHPNRIQVGQRIKLIRGPFHAIVRKSDFRLDLYVGPPDSEDQWLYVRSFPVGLGEGGSTPTGTFVVRPKSKLINPDWTNPRTGEHFASNDPKNPIGKRWIGLDGIGEAAGYAGYGLHGTIEPDSIGREMSMGCVRLADRDVELVYELLGEQFSVVIIEP